MGLSIATEEVEAVLVNCGGNLIKLPEKLAAVRTFSEMPIASDLAGANKRISNILKKNELTIPENVDDKLLHAPAEQLLFQQMGTLTPNIDQAIAQDDFKNFLATPCTI
jgi:glycyl-tRNA synthetase beta chain